MDTKKLKQFARGLLATTCLTAGVQAAVITESTDFGNAFALATVLPAGTNGVIGTVSTSDYYDWVKFTGLAPGPLTFAISYGTAVYPAFYNSANQVLAYGNSASVTVTVPGDGNLFLNVGYEGQSVGSYSVAFDSAVPEPGTVTGVGLGLAAAALAARKRTK